MSHRLGYCPQCGTKIMVQNMHGIYSSMKPNFMQIDLNYENGTSVRVHVCKDCAKPPAVLDFKKVGDEILAEGTEAFYPTIAEKVRSFGEPIGYSIPNVMKGFTYPIE